MPKLSCPVTVYQESDRNSSILCRLDTDSDVEVLDTVVLSEGLWTELKTSDGCVGFTPGNLTSIERAVLPMMPWRAHLGYAAIGLAWALGVTAMGWGITWTAQHKLPRGSTEVVAQALPVVFGLIMSWKGVLDGTPWYSKAVMWLTIIFLVPASPYAVAAILDFFGDRMR